MSEELDGDTVLLDLKKGLYFSLNSSGTIVWRLIREIGDFRKVREAFHASYDIDAEALDRDFLAIVETLQERGLVIYDDPTSP